MSDVKRFFIADTHFGEYNIIKFCGRPFASTRQMDEALVDRWNKVVTPYDEVWLLGDVGDSEMLGQLNGAIHIVQGNHDTTKDVVDWKQYDNVIAVYNHPVVLDDFFICSHHPMFVSYQSPYCNIFGHVHTNPTYKTASSRSYCVSVERNNYTPVDFEYIKTCIKQASDNSVSDSCL